MLKFTPASARPFPYCVQPIELLRPLTPQVEVVCRALPLIAAENRNKKLYKDRVPTVKTWFDVLGLPHTPPAVAPAGAGGAAAAAAAAAAGLAGA